MDKDSVKGQLVRDKEFLRELYQTVDVHKSKQILIFASDSQINTLIKFLHFLSNGDIKISKDNFNEIVKNRKLTILKKSVEKKAAVNRILKASRKVKLDFLKKLSTVYPHLLYCLFNQ